MSNLRNSIVYHKLLQTIKNNDFFYHNSFQTRHVIISATPKFVYICGPPVPAKLTFHITFFFIFIFKCTDN
jgi:hypothetical protein